MNFKPFVLLILLSGVALSAVRAYEKPSPSGKDEELMEYHNQKYGNFIFVFSIFVFSLNGIDRFRE